MQRHKKIQVLKSILSEVKSELKVVEVSSWG